MTADLELVLGRELLRPEAKDQVIARLAAVPISWVERRAAFARWARTVGATVTPDDFERVAPAPRRRAL